MYYRKTCALRPLLKNLVAVGRAKKVKERRDGGKEGEGRERKKGAENEQYISKINMCPSNTIFLDRVQGSSGSADRCNSTFWAYGRG